MTPACESCGADDRRLTNNRLPNGMSLDMCYPCVSDCMGWWHAWRTIQPSQASYVVRSRRQLDIAREELAKARAGGAD